MTVSRLDTLTQADVAAVQDLVAIATAADGVSALDEAALLRLTDVHSGGHLVLGSDRLLGYAQLGDTAALVVHPDARRVGHGSELLAELLGAGPRPLSVWAHGDLPAAKALARAFSLRRSRELWQLRRLLDETLPTVTWPSDVTVRSYVPGADDATWLALNAEAFADHPEQGRMTQADLDARLSSDWFDPAGFFLAERDGRAVGFHWTKVQERGRVGEVYVIGVAPGAQGGGLGRALTLHGLHHLRSTGLREVLLYVEADNTPAVAVYERLGFARAAVDVAYTADS
ncbi:MAG TPA: mycothiol synthase [Nocardioidaceae bacterium]|nr:mycothiol synthase [Nocardioidaceae bacterium]